MRQFFRPAQAPEWLLDVLSSIRAALSDIWPSPLRLNDYTTTGLPPAADWTQGLAYDSTLGRPKFSNGTGWLGLASVNSTGAVGYVTGQGGAVTQTTSRTTGVTLDKVCGAVTLVSAAGSATFAAFTVTNSTVAATDVIILSQKTGTDKYHLNVTAVGAGSFEISFATTGGTTVETPVFNFAVIKAVAA